MVMEVGRIKVTQPQAEVHGQASAYSGGEVKEGDLGANLKIES